MKLEPRIIHKEFLNFSHFELYVLIGFTLIKEECILLYHFVFPFLETVEMLQAFCGCSLTQVLYLNVSSWNFIDDDL